jgi:hypothetical protein
MSETDQFWPFANDRAELTEKSEYWKDRAEECRTLAELFRDRDAKEKMLRVSGAYERLAKRAKEG